MICGKCGKNIPDRARFCPYCGTEGFKSAVNPAKTVSNKAEETKPVKEVTIKTENVQPKSENSQTEKTENKTGKTKVIYPVIGIVVIILITVLAIVFINRQNNSKAVSSDTNQTVENTDYVSTDYQLGDRITFGKYEQDGNYANGEEDVVWMVIDKDETNKTLTLLSEKVLDYQIFGFDGNWSSSFIRDWLNNSFLNDVFNEGNDSDFVCLEIGLPTENQIQTMFYRSESVVAYATDLVKKNSTIYVNPDTGTSGYWLMTKTATNKVLAVRSIGDIFYDGWDPEKGGGVRPTVKVSY